MTACVCKTELSLSSEKKKKKKPAIQATDFFNNLQEIYTGLVCIQTIKLYKKCIFHEPQGEMSKSGQTRVSPSITDLDSAISLFPFFPQANASCDRFRNKRDKEIWIFLSYHFQGGVKRRPGLSPFQLHERPVILHLSHRHGLVEQDPSRLFFPPFLFKTWFLSLIFLYLSKPVIGNRGARRLCELARGVSNADRAKRGHRVLTRHIELLFAACFTSDERRHFDGRREKTHVWCTVETLPRGMLTVNPEGFIPQVKERQAGAS